MRSCGGDQVVGGSPCALLVEGLAEAPQGCRQARSRLNEHHEQMRLGSTNVRSFVGRRWGRARARCTPGKAGIRSAACGVPCRVLVSGRAATPGAGYRRRDGMPLAPTPVTRASMLKSRRRLPCVLPMRSFLRQTGLRQTLLRQTGLRQTGLRQTGLRQTGLRQTGLRADYWP